MSRPDENVDWAEGAGAQVSEPANERAGGFPFRYVPPAEQINWMWRAVGRWIRWLHLKLNNHVHDGGSGEMSSLKVDFNDHIDYGLHGELSIVTDTEETHEIQHRHSHGVAGECVFSTDTVKAETVELYEIIQTSSLVVVKNKNPANRSWLQVDGTIQASNDGKVLTKTLNTDSPANIPLRVEDVSENLTHIESLSTPRAMALISAPGGIVRGYKVTSATQDSAGVYHVTVPGITGADAIVLATAAQWIFPISITTTVGSGDLLIVRTFDDTGAAADCAFSLVIYW